MIDHVEGAENLLYASDSLIGQEEFAHADNAVKIAQVHATLALVEQQRIANLIALHEIGTPDYANVEGMNYGRLRKEILARMGFDKEALGL